MLRLAVRRARRLITVSESTRQDLVERLGARPERIRVIPNGVGAPFAPAPIAGGGGSDARRARRVAAVLPLRRQPAPAQEPAPAPRRLRRAPAGRSAGSCWSGSRRRTRAAVDARCAAPGLGARVRVLAPVPALVLARLYQSATVVVCPSLWEGFGLAALEAMACGAPVIAAKRGGLARGRRRCGPARRPHRR